MGGFVHIRNFTDVPVRQILSLSEYRTIRFKRKVPKNEAIISPAGGAFKEQEDVMSPTEEESFFTTVLCTLTGRCKTKKAVTFGGNDEVHEIDIKIQEEKTSETAGAAEEDLSPAGTEETFPAPPPSSVGGGCCGNQTAGAKKNSFPKSPKIRGLELPLPFADHEISRPFYNYTTTTNLAHVGSSSSFNEEDEPWAKAWHGLHDEEDEKYFRGGRTRQEEAWGGDQFPSPHQRSSGGRSGGVNPRNPWTSQTQENFFQNSGRDVDSDVGAASEEDEDDIYYHEPQESLFDFATADVAHAICLQTLSLRARWVLDHAVLISNKLPKEARPHGEGLLDALDTECGSSTADPLRQGQFFPPGQPWMTSPEHSHFERTVLELKRLLKKNGPGSIILSWSPDMDPTKIDVPEDPEERERKVEEKKKRGKANALPVPFDQWKKEVGKYVVVASLLGVVEQFWKLCILLKWCASDAMATL